MRDTTPGNVSTRRVGDIRAEQRRASMKESYQHYLVRIVGVLAVVVAVVAVAFALYRSPLFSVTDIQVDGTYYLTADEVCELADVGDTTLLRIDTAAVENRIEASPWVESATVSRLVPHGIRIAVTEKPVLAVVKAPITASQLTQQDWLMASDGTWLTVVDSTASDDFSKKVVQTADSLPVITDVASTAAASEGGVCGDAGVTNALAILKTVSTDLSSQIAQISAPSAEQTQLVLDNGVTVAFGSVSDASAKERVVLQLLAEHEGEISYINVRVADRPAWRGLESS